ncbi:MAG: hypothetical protein ABI839_06920 [Verrucomicrobiota bacterium]
MKRSVLILSLLAACGVIAYADEVVPTRPDFSRFAPMLKRSPFAVATAVAPSATPDFAKDLYIANAAHSSAEDIATIASSIDRNFKKYPTTKTPDGGYGIAHIEWSDRVGETKVTITKDGKYATLAFNQALLLQPVGSAPQAQLQLPVQPAINPLAPVPVPVNPAYPKPAPIPSLPPQALVPPPFPAAGVNVPPTRFRSRGMIQRNPAVTIPTPVPTPVPDTEDEEN